MKRIILLLSCLIGILNAKAQNGLEGIIIEKYYISDENDTSANSTDGRLPVGSTTYRIYVDMLKGYKFQAAYGTTESGIPTHELRIATSTLFFNNENRGSTTPTFTKNQLKSNTLMLDSWLSVGAACSGNYGVLKDEDDGVNTVVNNDGLLQNDNSLAGIPLKDEDGLLAGTPGTLTAVGINTEMSMFDSQNDGTNGPVFSTWNGSWACLGGATGPDTNTNKVLIAQMTTDGDFSFELNIQLGTPTGGVEQYVAKNPLGSEIMLSDLTYFSPGVSTKIDNTDGVNTFLNVYPNPAKNLLSIAVSNVESSNNYYSIYDTKGTLVDNQSFGKVAGGYRKNIDISAYAEGIYFLVVSLDGKMVSKKIVKM